MQGTVAMRPAEKLQALALQRMVIAQDGYFGRETFEVGSVSLLPSIPFLTPSS